MRDNTMKVTDRGNREGKSSVFTAYFSESKNAAALYDSLTGTIGTKPEDIEYETLEAEEQENTERERIRAGQAEEELRRIKELYGII